jgi:hypothetical protein
VLVGHGHEVIGFDTGFYVDGLLYDAPASVRTMRKDIRVLDEAISTACTRDVNTLLHLVSEHVGRR